MAGQKKSRRFDWQKGRRLAIMRRLAQNDRIPISGRITSDKVVDGLIADANRKKK